MQCQNPCSAAFNRPNELLEVHFEFHFNQINQLHNGLLTLETLRSKCEFSFVAAIQFLEK